MPAKIRRPDRVDCRRSSTTRCPISPPAAWAHRLAQPPVRLMPPPPSRRLGQIAAAQPVARTQLSPSSCRTSSPRGPCTLRGPLVGRAIVLVVLLGGGGCGSLDMPTLRRSCEMRLLTGTQQGDRGSTKRSIALLLMASLSRADYQESQVSPIRCQRHAYTRCRRQAHMSTNAKPHRTSNTASHAMPARHFDNFDQTMIALRHNTLCMEDILLNSPKWCLHWKQSFGRQA